MGWALVKDRHELDRLEERDTYNRRLEEIADRQAARDERERRAELARKRDTLELAVIAAKTDRKIAECLSDIARFEARASAAGPAARVDRLERDLLARLDDFMARIERRLGERPVASAGDDLSSNRPRSCGGHRRRSRASATTGASSRARSRRSWLRWAVTSRSSPSATSRRSRISSRHSSRPRPRWTRVRSTSSCARNRTGTGDERPVSSGFPACPPPRLPSGSLFLDRRERAGRGRGHGRRRRPQ